MTLVPTKLFLTKGMGRHKDKLQSFELALRDAGIQHCNLVSVSSIVPPNCEIISAEEGIKLLKPGQITFVVLAQNATNEANRLIAASVGLALPKDRSFYGYLSEYHSFGESAKKAGDYAEDLAATMLATTLGIEFDADKAWDEKKQVFEMSGKIVKTTSVTQAARGKEGVWTTVIAAAVFIME
ncbi:MAG: arginine decarboxylase, pyruvoyl-dependent [Thermoplasmata archaeon]|nr:arginine decarboxylase, pyruvoyl-dependent [Thermoplasmata archaeon]